MKIGEISGITGLTIDTIRYYEKRGLITKPERRYSGYRIFEIKHVDELRFIKRAHELGFTLSEIKNLMNLRFNKASDCSGIKHITEMKCQRITAMIRELEQIRSELIELTGSCSGRMRVDECPVLKVRMMESNSKNDMIPEL